MTINDIIEHASESERFTVEGYRGIAFYFAGEQKETVYSDWGDPVDYTETGMVYMVMVGDDCKHIIDPEDVTVISDDDYCHECGQIGCKADGR